MSRGQEPIFPTIRDSLEGPLHGMSLREYYAGLAMAALRANSHPDVVDHASHGAIASEAVKCADALLAELERTKGGQTG